MADAAPPFTFWLFLGFGMCFPKIAATTLTSHSTDNASSKTLLTTGPNPDSNLTPDPFSFCNRHELQSEQHNGLSPSHYSFHHTNPSTIYYYNYRSPQKLEEHPLASARHTIHISRFTVAMSDKQFLHSTLSPSLCLQGLVKSGDFC